MLPHLLILLAGIYLGFCLGLFVCILRIRASRALHGPRAVYAPPSVHGHYPAPDISQTWAFHLIGIRACTHQEAQHIAAHLRLQ